VVIDPKTALRVEERGKNREYVFLCLDCGKEITRRSDFLKTNDAPGKCRACANKNNWWTVQLRPYEHILTCLRGTCKDRGIKVDLSYEDLLYFVSQKTCEYCNKELIWIERQTKRTSGATNLDRKESDRGYSRNNCVPCCWECNRIKGNVYTYQEMKIIGLLFKQLREAGSISSRLTAPWRKKARSLERAKFVVRW